MMRLPPSAIPRRLESPRQQSSINLRRFLCVTFPFFARLVCQPLIAGLRLGIGLEKGKGEKKEKKKKESKGKHYKSSSRSYANHVKCQPNILNMFDAYAIGCTSGCQTASNCVKLGFISGIEK